MNVGHGRQPLCTVSVACAFPASVAKEFGEEVGFGTPGE